MSKQEVSTTRMLANGVGAIIEENLRPTTAGEHEMWRLGFKAGVEATLYVAGQPLGKED